MTSTEHRETLHALALLYLGMAHRADDYLSDAELKSVTERVQAQAEGFAWEDVQDVVLAALDVYVDADAPEALTATAAERLAARLTPAERKAVLDDLRHVAGADGVVLADEHGLLARVALQWDLPTVHEPAEAVAGRPAGAQGILYDLAYIYLHLAHGTDNELSPPEMQVMMNRLREWQPGIAPADMQRLMDTAMAAYARGVGPNHLDDAIASVRRHLPQAQRRAALHDLIKIANADGVFLDNEEDMINHLVAAWDIDPSTNYEEDRGRG